MRQQGITLASFLKSVVCTTILVLGLSGCVGGPVTARYKELHSAMAPLRGQHKDAVLIKLGPPQEDFKTDSVEVWRYKISHAYQTSRKGMSEEYDQIDVTIVRDTVSDFRIRVIR